MTRCRSHSPLFPLLLLVALAVTAILPGKLPAEEPRMYRVEVVLLRHTDADALLKEVWRSGDVAGLEHALDLTELDEDEVDHLFRDVSGTPFGLRGVVNRLEQSPLYDVIASYAWEQPGLPQEQAIPVRIRSGQVLGRMPPAFEPPPFAPWQIQPVLGGVPEQPDEPELLYEVDGVITLTLARFLHIHTDLLYRPATGDRLPGDHVTTLEGDQFAESHVTERRRMRSGETHYLDHPLMGVIVHVTPVED
ncbi:CsiV family protein [Thioalkalivibrio denitrificans]|nr:CsiV family protein [Thioalkalivibrio denitrificans]